MSTKPTSQWAENASPEKTMENEFRAALADFAPDVIGMMDELFGIDTEKANKELFNAMKIFDV